MRQCLFRTWIRNNNSFRHEVGSDGDNNCVSTDEGLITPFYTFDDSSFFLSFSNPSWFPSNCPVSLSSPFLVLTHKDPLPPFHDASRFSPTPPHSKPPWSYYRVFNLDWEEVSSFYPQKLLFNNLKLFFYEVLCFTFFVSKFYRSVSNILSTISIWSKTSIFG